MTRKTVCTYATRPEGKTAKMKQQHVLLIRERAADSRERPRWGFPHKEPAGALPPRSAMLLASQVML